MAEVPLSEFPPPEPFTLDEDQVIFAAPWGSMSECRDCVNNHDVPGAVIDHGHQSWQWSGKPHAVLPLSDDQTPRLNGEELEPGDDGYDMAREAIEEEHRGA